LLHETLIGLNFTNELPEHLEALTQLNALIADEIGQDECCASALAFD